MSKESRLVVKDNSLIDASFYLSLVEQRLMLLGIYEARNLDKLTFETPVKVSVKSYIDAYKVASSTAYESIQDAVNTLFERQFSYYDPVMDERFKERWIYKASYMDDKGHVVMFFTPTVIKMISRLEANFTKYLIEEVSEFKSKYSIRLYELLIKWKNVGHTEKFEIADLRSKLGLNEDEYKLTADFKKRVLDVAIKEINKSDNTDIQIKYEQFKEGRTISHIQFKLIKKKEKKSKTSKDQNTVDMFTGMSDKQILMFSDKLSRDNTFQNHYTANVGELEKDYAIRIADELMKPDRVLEWLPYLKAVGYVPTNK